MNRFQWTVMVTMLVAPFGSAAGGPTAAPAWHHDRAILEARIRSEPHELDVIAVYADLNQDHDDETRALFARQQYFMERGLPGIPGVPSAEEILKAHGSSWLPYGKRWTLTRFAVLEPGRTRATHDLVLASSNFWGWRGLMVAFRRGVVDQVVVPFDFLRKTRNVEKLEAILAETRFSLFVIDVPVYPAEAIQTVLSLPFLSKLETLGFSFLWHGAGTVHDGILERIADADLSSLQTLSMLQGTFESDLSPLADSHRLSKLRVLDLRDCRLNLAQMGGPWRHRGVRILNQSIPVDVGRLLGSRG